MYVIGYQFGQPDFYFVLIMTPKDEDKTEIKIQEDEVAVAKWFPIMKIA